MGKKLKFIDLFSGCGGFSKGFEMAGMECLLGVDFNKDAIDTFLRNHKRAKAHCGDISDITPRKLREYLDGQTVDIVIGGPPCQGFSTVGKGETGDDRNFLFQEFVRIVRLTKPKAIVLENVTGLLAKKNEKVLDLIFSQFERLGYKMDARVLCADEYGVAETRRRTIIMGTKGDVMPQFPKVTHGDRGERPISTLGDVLKNLSDENGNTHNHDIEGASVKNSLDRERLKCIPEGRGIRYERDEVELLPNKLHYNVVWKELAEGRFRQSKLQRLDRSKPSPTIMTSRTSYYHPTEIRYLTAREAAAIQSFPNDFIFSGSNTSQFRQIGNAVPPLLAKSIAISLMDALTGKARSKKQKEFHDIKKNAFHYQNKTHV